MLLWQHHGCVTLHTQSYSDNKGIPVMYLNQVLELVGDIKHCTLHGWEVKGRSYCITTTSHQNTTNHFQLSYRKTYTPTNLAIHPPHPPHSPLPPPSPHTTALTIESLHSRIPLTASLTCGGKLLSSSLHTNPVPRISNAQATQYVV